MDNNIRVRSNIFHKLMKDAESERNWEMLCSVNKPLVPFIGAGISSWCYPMWDDLLKAVVRENFSEECSRIVAEALRGCKNREYKPIVEDEEKTFRWMEEIAEYIFDDDEKAFNTNKNMFQLKRGTGGQTKLSVEQEKANRTLENLHRCLGGYGVKTRRAAVQSLYKAFDIAQLKKVGKFPEYQNFFPRLFSDLLVTTNYDKALERCYPSIFSYSYSDLNERAVEEAGDAQEKKSWLYRAVEEKLEQMQARLQGIDRAADMALPDVPMLLKVHGSIEQASNIVLSRERYTVVYNKEMPRLFRHICQHSALIFMGCGLREDRILDELKKQKLEAEANHDHSFQHFAFYAEPAEPAEKIELKRRLDEYGIYPVFYRKSALDEVFRTNEEEYHNNCLGILLENLLRRKLHYHQPLELLWDNSRFAPLEISGNMKSAARIQSVSKNAQYVRMEEAEQIWELLKSSAECPLIAVTGDTGSGKSTFCQNIQKMNTNPKDAMQFFYVPLEDCKTWNEFCIQIYQNLNIISSEMEESESWRTVAERIEHRCNGYWRSVLILDHLDELEDEATYPGQWEAIRNMLDYWKEHQIRVIFTIRKYPKGISCHTWHIDVLPGQDAKKVFFSACTSRRYENRSLLEQNTLNELFSRASFQPASAYLLGRYADSKNDLATLLEEWESCCSQGDSAEHTLARLMWKHLLDEHQWSDKKDGEKRDIEKNILWIWGILGAYPGIFPRAFFECIWSDESGYQNKALSQKTLIYMKNAGLCEETVDEKYGFLLQNMIQCAEKFSAKLKLEVPEYGNFDLAENVNLNGLKSFRGYAMDKYDGDLRSYVLKEWSKKSMEPLDSDEMDAANAVLDILETLGKNVENDRAGRDHKDLNLVLHYEIKTVIRFLFTQLSRADAKDDRDKQKRIAKIGYSFAHYYHYVPSNAFPMVQQLINAAEKNRTSSGKNDDGIALYELANLYKVRGDIHKLLGRKNDAVKDYKEARQLCEGQMLQSFTDPLDITPYRESRRILASVLLLNKYCGLTANGEGEIENAGELYRQIDDKCGIAYYNQCRGEAVFDERPEDTDGEEFDRFDEVCHYYNEAARYYGEEEDMNGIAYILKCMGDLLGACRSTYKKKTALWLWKVLLSRKKLGK